MNNHDAGHFGYGIAGGRGIEGELFQNRVVQGLLAAAPTSASTQATGAGAFDYNVDISAGLIVVGGAVLEADTQADFNVDSGAVAVLTSGQSRVYSIIVHRSVADGKLRWQAVGGAAAATGSEKVPTAAEIAAVLTDQTRWVVVANVTFNRTGDLTVTQSKDNSVRPLFYMPN